MKKIIFVLLAFVSLSAGAEIITMDAKSSKNELFIDETDLYRYKRAEEMYKDECGDIFSEEVKKKCLEAEKARWAKGKTSEEVKKEGTLFTGKILIPSAKGTKTYFYVNQGKQGKQINLLLNQYYFENGILYSIETEEPVSGEIIIGGVEGLSDKKGHGQRFIVQQKYEEGKVVGDPVVLPAK